MDWYEGDVRALERDVVARVDGTRPPVFYGSSSIRLWSTLAQDFDARVVNLGFGGATLEACDFFFPRLIPPVKPRSLLVYAGDNDLGDGGSPAQVLARYRSLADKVKESLRDIPFGFVSVKPSPARFSILDRIRRANQLVLEEIQGRASAFYVDVFSAMLDEEGKPESGYFTEDGLHMNHTGYLLWSKLLQPYRHQIFTE